MPSLTLDWLHLLVLLGACQGVLLTISLALHRHNRVANRLLAAAMLAFSIHLASTAFTPEALLARLPHAFGIAWPLPYLYGPLVYLYARTAADRARGLRRGDALHFLPFVLVVALGAPIYLLSAADKVSLYHTIESGNPPLLLAIAGPLKLVSGITYAALTLRFLARHREEVKASYSSTEQVNLDWLLWLSGGAAGVWALAVAFELLDLAGAGRVAHADDWVSLAIALLVYAIGYRGLRQPEVFHYETAEYAIPVPPAAAGPEPGEGAPASPEPGAPGALAFTSPEPGAPAAARYGKSALSDREAARLKDRLLARMDEDRPWADSELTLADLAARLDTTPHKLSELLNDRLGVSFYDFVNGYRVREVERRIAEGDADRVKILALALDAGFASKSTFNQVFKKHTNRTPSQFARFSSARADESRHSHPRSHP